MKTRRLDTAAQFQQTIKQGVTLVDFSAPWCGPCRAQEPILVQLAERFYRRATIASMNIDDHPQTARHLGIVKIPTLALFRNGREVTRFVGVQRAETLAEAIFRTLNLDRGEGRSADSDRPVNALDSTNTH